MKYLKYEDLKKLVHGRPGACISIYIPTKKSGPEIEQNKIRLKNMLQRAEQLLTDERVRRAERNLILAPARRLLEDRQFWQQAQKGLAIFLSLEDHHIFRVPLEVNESITISHHYRLKQLLPLVADRFQVAVLALSQKNMRLYRVDQFSLKRVNLENCPSNIDELLQFEDPEKQIQQRSIKTGGGNTEGSIFHGQGGASDEKHKKLIRLFFQQVEKEVTSYLNRESLPLLLCGQEHLIGIYRQVNALENILDTDIKINPDALSEDQILEKASATVKIFMEKMSQFDLEKYKQLAGTGRAVNELQKVIAASYAKRIKTLFVQKGRQVFGRYDKKWHDVVFHPRDKQKNVDLIDSAAVQTILSGGQVYFLEMEDMPEKAMLAAIMRY